MNPGALRYRIEIHDKKDAQNPQTGYMDTEKPLVCALRASRSDASTREVWEAYAAKARNVVNWECRLNPTVRVGHWVVWKGQWHEIIAVQHPNGLPPRMILKTILKEAK